MELYAAAPGRIRYIILCEDNRCQKKIMQYLQGEA